MVHFPLLQIILVRFNDFVGFNSHFILIFLNHFIYLYGKTIIY